MLDRNITIDSRASPRRARRRPLDSLPRRIADFATLGEALDYAAQRPPRPQFPRRPRHAGARLSLCRAARRCARQRPPLHRARPQAGRPRRAGRRDRARVRRLLLRRGLCRRCGRCRCRCRPASAAATPMSTSSRSSSTAATRRCSSIPAELAEMAGAAAAQRGVAGARLGEPRRRRAGRRPSCPRPAPTTSPICNIRAARPASRTASRSPTARCSTISAPTASASRSSDTDRCISLAALVSRHGPGRLPAVAGRQPDVGRLSEDRGFRPPPARLARPDQPQPGHDAQLFADLRLRHLRAPDVSRRPAPPTASTCRAGGSPATAPT